MSRFLTCVCDRCGLTIEMPWVVVQIEDVPHFIQDPRAKEIHGWITLHDEDEVIDVCVGCSTPQEHEWLGWSTPDADGFDFAAAEIEVEVDE